jgi:hypothetical protein
MEHNLVGVQKELDGLGFMAVRRLMDVTVFCAVTGLARSSVMHGLARFDHLRVRSPFRRVLFDAVKVQRAIESGDLRGN